MRCIPRLPPSSSNQISSVRNPARGNRRTVSPLKLKPQEGGPPLAVEALTLTSWGQYQGSYVTDRFAALYAEPSTATGGATTTAAACSTTAAASKSCQARSRVLAKSRIQLRFPVSDREEICKFLGRIDVG